MKVRIQSGVIAMMTMIAINSRANVQHQPLNNTMPSGYSYVAAEGAKQTMVFFIIQDSLLLLQKNYPAVYNHLLREFKNATSLYYSADENILLISFTSNHHKILTVYSTNGEFRHSIAEIGTELPGMIAEQLKKEYPAYSVYYGKEIRTNNKNIYQVVIENDYEYRLVNFLDSEMEEVKRLKK
ncbi:MAG: hypothetical protein ABI675_23695 [Chitinophagaceae bacterium]